MADIEKVMKALKCRAKAGSRCSNPCERIGVCEYAKQIVGLDGEPYYPFVCDKKRICEDALELLKEQRKKGHWIEKGDYNMDVYYDCSVCGESWTTIEGTPWENGMNYCPHCGADMH